jgi:hypothetical protein
LAGTNNIRYKAKTLWIKGMKSIGNTAASIANNTRNKVDEMTLQNRRSELSGELSRVVYSLWLKGTEFPPEVTQMLEELQELDDRLNDIRAEKSAQTETATSETDDGEETGKDADGTRETPGEEPVAEGPAEKPKEEAEEEAEEEEPLSEAITMASTALRSEINGYFDEGASVDKAAEKVNASLAQLTDKIRAFSPEKSEETE